MAAGDINFYGEIWRFLLPAEIVINCIPRSVLSACAQVTQLLSPLITKQLMDK